MFKAETLKAVSGCFVLGKWSCEQSLWEPLRHTGCKAATILLPYQEDKVQGCVQFPSAGPTERKSGRKRKKRPYQKQVSASSQSIIPSGFPGEKVRNSVENVRLCIYMETITGLLYNRIQNHHTIGRRKKNNKVLNVLRDCSRWLWANTCPFSSKHMRFLLTLVIFPWRILGMLPYSLFLLLSVVQIYVSGHYIFRFILLLASIPSPHRQI